MNELLGAKYDPIFFHVIQIKNNDEKKRIDEKCLTSKMETSIFIYPSKDKTKTKRFCNQQEYLNVLKNNLNLKIDDE